MVPGEEEKIARETTRKGLLNAFRGGVSNEATPGEGSPLGTLRMRLGRDGAGDSKQIQLRKLRGYSFGLSSALIKVGCYKMIADFYWSPLALGQSLRKPIILGAKGLAEQVQYFLPSLKN